MEEMKEEMRKLKHTKQIIIIIVAILFCSIILSLILFSSGNDYLHEIEDSAKSNDYLHAIVDSAKKVYNCEKLGGCNVYKCKSDNAITTDYINAYTNQYRACLLEKNIK